MGVWGVGVGEIMHMIMGVVVRVLGLADAVLEPGQSRSGNTHTSQFHSGCPRPAPSWYRS